MARIVRAFVGGLVTFGVVAVAAGAGPLTADDLQGTWKLREMRSRPVRPETAEALPRFTIRNQAIEGFDGCNEFWGRLDQPGSMASTRRGCPDARLTLPLDLADPWSHLQAGKVDGGRLMLPERGTVPASVFERTE